MTVERYGGLRKATIVVRDDGKLDVLRERAGSGEWFRGCGTLDEALEVVRAHGTAPCTSHRASEPHLMSKPVEGQGK